MSPEIGDPVEHRVDTVAKWGPECYIWDMIKSNAPAAGSTAHGPSRSSCGTDEAP